MEQALGNALVFDDGHPALFALVGVSQRQFKSRAGGTGKDGAHQSIGLGVLGVDCFLVMFWIGYQVIQGQLDIVKEDLALVQCALAHLLQWLTPTDTGRIERDHYHTATLGVGTGTRVGRRVENAEFSNSAVGNPGGHLSVDHQFVALKRDHAVGAAVFALRMKGLLADIQ